MCQYLAAGDVTNMLVIFMRLFSGLSCRDHKDAVSVKTDQDVLTGTAPEQAEERPGVSEPNSAVNFMESLSLKKGENFYRSVLQACLWSAGADVRPEAGKNRGQADMEVKYKDLSYIIEMKTAEDSPAALKSAQAGMTRIRGRDYGGASKNPILISLAVDLKARNIGACVFVKNGQTHVLDSQDLLQLREPPSEEAE
ncbi:MAG: PD-(D/E)XK nuclease domain-containing protein [Deltaproteobacteria bacterium]|nr:PD-(D/E)XK nuclease domain-containing protein [Deltaproteobacteria bacterium]